MTAANIQAAVSQTLFIPLAARALESRRDDPVILDDKAVEIMARLDADAIADGGLICAHGILARTKVIDDEIKGLLLEKPDIALINLGAGLDTRICRVDNGRFKCFELDLPDVIALRRQFFAEDERIRFIAASVLDDAWARALEGIDACDTVIIAEGLLMYFPSEDVRKIFHLLAGHFPGAHMYFDVVHSFFVGKGISGAFQWGLDKAKDIERMSPDIRLVRSWSTGDLLKRRQPFLFRIMNILPLTRNRSQILHVQFGEQSGMVE